MTIKKIILWLIIFSCSYTLLAQENAISKAMNNNTIRPIKTNNKVENSLSKNTLSKNWSFSIGYGLTQFNGDIRQYNHYPAYNQKNDFHELRSAISISLTKQMNPFYSISGELLSGNFAGLRKSNEYLGYSIYDPWGNYEGDGDKFITSFKEADLIINLEISKLSSYLRKSRSNKLKKISLISKLGLGYNVFNTLRTNLNSNTYLHDFGYETTQSYAELGSSKHPLHKQIKETVYVYGFKAKYQLNTSSSLWIDYTIRNGKTDKWDGSIMKTQNIRDQFAFLSIGVTYAIGDQDEKNDWHSPIEGLQEDVKTISVKIDGFTDDSDNDGIADAFDKSPNTPIGVSIDGSGTPLDVDMDNIPDYRDADPFSNRGAQVNENGIELDDDKDGVPNSKDLEVNTIPGSMVNQFGINIDATQKKDNQRLIYLPSVFFNSGSSIVDESNRNRLATIALMLNKNKTIQMNVIGHTDEVGNKENNNKLGMKRAVSVINYLKKNYNINEDRLTAVTKGEEEPLLLSTPKSNPLEIKSKVIGSSQINRRVDFEVINE